MTDVLSSGENRGSRCGAMVSTTNGGYAQLSSPNQRVGGSIPSRRTISAGHRPASGGPPHVEGRHPHLVTRNIHGLVEPQRRRGEATALGQLGDSIGGWVHRFQPTRWRPGWNWQLPASLGATSQGVPSERVPSQGPERWGRIGKPVRIRRGPATVTGEFFPMCHWAAGLGRRERAAIRQPGDRPCG